MTERDMGSPTPTTSTKEAVCLVVNPAMVRLPPKGVVYLPPGPKEPTVDVASSYSPGDIRYCWDLYKTKAFDAPSLTSDQEIELGRKVRAGQKAGELLQQQTGIDAEETLRFEKTVRQGQEARDQMILASTRLVSSIAKRYTGQGLPFPDLIQEGNVGLMRAVDRFDPERGYRFSTYATWWIRKLIRQAIADSGNTIRLPGHMKDNLNRLCKLQSELQKKLGRPPSIQELKETMGVSEKRAAKIIHIWETHRTISLDKSVGKDKDTPFLDFVSDPKAPDPEKIAANNILRETLEKLLNTLTPRQAKVIMLKFGLQDGYCYTLEEIGRKFGLTRERIRQIEAEALGRLRHPSRTRPLKSYL